MNSWCWLKDDYSWFALSLLLADSFHCSEWRSSSLWCMIAGSSSYCQRMRLASSSQNSLSWIRMMSSAIILIVGFKTHRKWCLTKMDSDGADCWAKSSRFLPTTSFSVIVKDVLCYLCGIAAVATAKQEAWQLEINVIYIYIYCPTTSNIFALKTSDSQVGWKSIFFLCGTFTFVHLPLLKTVKRNQQLTAITKKELLEFVLAKHSNLRMYEIANFAVQQRRCWAFVSVVWFAHPNVHSGPVELPFILDACVGCFKLAFTCRQWWVVLLVAI